MAVFRFLSQWFLSFLIVLTPFAANAQSATPAFEQRMDRLFGNSAENLEVRHFEDRTQFVRRDSRGQEFILEESKASDRELQKYSPKNLAKTFEAERQKALKGKGPKQSTFKHTLQRYPGESARFFMAIGAVTAYQLFTDYSANPLRMEQHIEHSFSGVGMMSFFMFMYANGVTANVLQNILKNPKHHIMIPYLGMTAGFFVQSAISTFAMDPNVIACVGGFFGKKSEVQGAHPLDPCDAAFNYYVLKGKMDELAPGLISMLASSVFAAAAEKLVAGTIYRLTGFQLLLWVALGGVGIQSVRFMIYSMVQMGVFYYMDVAFFNRGITYGWRNIMDGREFQRIETEIVSHLIEKKKNGWASAQRNDTCLTLQKEHDCYMDLPSTIKKFSQRASNWRMMNLMEVYEAHQAWEKNLANLNSQFSASYDFYSAFVAEARDRHYKFVTDSRLDVQSPLLGVSLTDTSEETKGLQFSSPQTTRWDASKTVTIVGKQLEDQLKTEMAFAGKASNHRTKFLLEIAKKLQAPDPSVAQESDLIRQGQTIKEIYEARERFQGLGSWELVKQLEAIINAMGNPDPTFEPGVGFLKTYEKWSSGAESLSEAKFPGITGIFRTPRKTQHLLMQMACGPATEKNESVVGYGNGLPAEFYAPKITVAANRPMICEGRLEEHSNMFNYSFESNGKKYSSVLDYVKNNVRVDVLGLEQSENFGNWWTSKTEKKMKDSYERFAEYYDAIIVKLLKSMRFKGSTKFLNQGPVPNGTIAAVRQEMRLHLMLMGELFKDLYRIQNQQAVPAYYFSSRPEPKPEKLDPKYGKFPLLTMLNVGGYPRDGAKPAPGLTTVMEWDGLRGASTYPGETLGHLKAMNGYPLQIQKEIEFEFETLIALFNQLKIVEIDGRERVQSSLSNKDFEKQVKKISKKINQFMLMLSPGEEALKKGPGVTLDLEQSELMATSMGALNDIANEIAMYGIMSNAVSWEKIRDLKNLSAGQKKFNNAAQARASEISNMMNKRMGH
jgi:hypothetical protein